MAQIQTERDIQSSAEYKMTMEIYVINLDRRPDRLREMTRHLNNLGLTFTRISAVDGLKLEEYQYSIVDRATDACWRSHQLAYGAAVSSLSDNALILEDDAILDQNTDWPELLKELDIYVTRSGIDVLQLGFEESLTYPSKVERNLVSFYLVIKRVLKFVHANAFGKSRTTAKDTRWDCLDFAPRSLQFVPNEFGGGCHCYVISRRAATTCLNLNRPTFLPADDLFWMLAASSPAYLRFKIAKARRSLSVQRNRPGGIPIDSDIEPHIRPL